MTEYKVEEIHCGCCTGTIRGKAVEGVISKNAQNGWKFEGFESVMGRKCCAPVYSLLVAFSRETI